MSLIEKEMMSGLFSVLVGSIVIIFRKRFAEEIIAFQNTVWGFKFGKKEIYGTKILVTIVGIIAILFGFMKIGLF